MKILRFIAEWGAGILFSLFSLQYQEFSLYFFIIAVISVILGILDLGYNGFYIKWKMKKLSRYIIIEPDTKNVEILAGYTPYKLRFSFKVKNLLKEKIVPKYGKVSIYHGGQFIANLEYNSDIGTDYDGVFMWEVDIYSEEEKREGYIWVQITIPKIKTIYQWELKSDFKFQVNKLPIRKKMFKEGNKFILSSQQQETILRKMKEWGEL